MYRYPFVWSITAVIISRWFLVSNGVNVLIFIEWISCCYMIDSSNVTNQNTKKKKKNVTPCTQYRLYQRCISETVNLAVFEFSLNFSNFEGGQNINFFYEIFQCPWLVFILLFSNFLLDRTDHGHQCDAMAVSLGTVGRKPTPGHHSVDEYRRRVQAD